LNKIFISVIMTVTLFYGCSSTAPTITKSVPYQLIAEPYYEIPPDLENDELRTETIRKYSEYLKGVKIFLDPGHGGSDRRNSSLSGAVVEADVNLNVGLFLQEFLEEAGSIVFMSREYDETVELARRSELANESGADLFISLHHNAAPRADNYWTNYTSTYYHATENDYEYEPCERDLARYIQRDVSYVMGNSGGLGSFDGTISDYVIYPGDGFSVLRKTEMPAVLIECAFHTNRMEERRLLEEEFNQIEAWGIFRGLGKYFQTGIPKIELMKEESQLAGGELNLFFSLEDERGIEPKSIVVYFDSLETKHEFIEEESKLVVQIENASEGEHSLRVVCANKLNKYSFPFHKKIILQ